MLRPVGTNGADNPAFNGDDGRIIESTNSPVYDVESTTPAGEQLPTSLVACTPPSLETKWFWSVDGGQVSVGAQVIRLWLSVVVLLQLTRQFMGNPSMVTWRDLGAREQVWLHELGRNVTSEQAVLMEGMKLHGKELIDAGLLGMGIVAVVVFESLISISHPVNGELARIYADAMVSAAETRTLNRWTYSSRVFMLMGCVLLAKDISSLFMSGVDSHLRYFLDEVGGTKTFTNCSPKPSWASAEMAIPPGEMGDIDGTEYYNGRGRSGTTYASFAESTQGQAELRAGWDSGTNHDASVRCREEFINYGTNKQHWEWHEQIVTVSSSFLWTGRLPQAADGWAMACSFILTARWLFVMRSACGIVIQRVKNTEALLAQPAEVVKDWDALKHELRTLTQEIIPCVTSGFSTALAAVIIAFALMLSGFISCLVQGEDWATVLICFCGIFVVGPVYVPAAVTSACHKLYAGLNELYEADDIDQTIEVERMIKMHCEYLRQQNQGQGPGFEVLGMVVSRKLIKQAITGGGTVALTIAASMMS